MSARATLATPLAPARATQAFPTLLILMAALIATGLIFHTEVAAAVTIWSTSTAYSHCFLVLPVVGFLAYERRAALGQTADPAPIVLLLIAPVALDWLAAQRHGIMEARQLLALTIAEILAFALLGPALWRRLAVPLLYLYFLVPFGDFLTPALQAFTVSFIDHGLDVLGIPHLVQATVIEIPAGAFRVAEACAGLRFLIASIAFGVLYACTLYRSPGRRIAFIAASIIVPIIANGFRALGIVVLGNILGDTQAAAIDHVLYGWLFFSLVTLFLIAAGLRFREDHAPIPVPVTIRPRAASSAPLLITAAIGLIVAATAPAAALWLDRGAGNTAEPITLPTLALPSGCTRQPDTGSDIHVICDDLPITLRLRRYPATAAPGTLLQAERSLAGPGEIVASSPIVTPARQWFIRRTTEPVRLYAIGQWLTNDASPTGGLTWRLHQAIRQLRGAPANAWHPIIAVANLDTRLTDQLTATATLRRLLLAQPDLATVAQR